MKFYIENFGDDSVGIQGFSCQVIIPNVVGVEESDWIEWCKGFLHELYSAETTSIIYTEKENEQLQNEYLWEQKVYEAAELYEEEMEKVKLDITIHFTE